MKFKNEKSPFDNRVFKIVFSIVAAVICWMVVAFTVSNTITDTIRDVPVTISTTSATYQSLGLDIIDDTDITVDVKVEGPRAVIGRLDKNSIRVTPSFSNVREAGTYDLQLTVTKTNQLDDFTVVAVEPAKITLRFDNAVSRKLQVTTNLVGLEAAEGYIVDTPVVNPAEITVTGPELDVNAVSKAVVNVVVNRTVSESVRQTCEVILLDSDGEQIVSDTLRLDNEQVDVVVPVYKRGVLPLDIEFTNVPEGFDIETLRYSLSRPSINVAASTSVIDNLSTKIIGYVDLAAFEIGESYLFDVELPSGMVNLDNVNQVTVTFQQENLASKQVNVTDIRVQNAPADLNVSVHTERISGVTVIGPQEDIDALMPGSVIAIVDMDEQITESGSYNVPVKFMITANSTTFVSGVYTVLIDVELA